MQVCHNNNVIIIIRSSGSHKCHRQHVKLLLSSDQSSDEPLDSVEEWDPVFEWWTSLEGLGMENPRAGFAAASIDDLSLFCF